MAAGTRKDRTDRATTTVKETELVEPNRRTARSVGTGRFSDTEKQAATVYKSTNHHETTGVGVGQRWCGGERNKYFLSSLYSLLCKMEALE
ncbi:hypothetical protein P8452_35280 [Trifolium repens]|nr:hypothetical protein P8452_35280 [Trifolium repens]